MIPISAVDHVEIVSDGSSAFYGSDAVGGVINVIMKSNFNGWEAGIHWGESSNRGYYTERSGYITGGVSTKDTSFLVSVEGSETSPIYMNQRPYSNPIYTTTTYPGVVSVQPFSITFDPNTGQPITQPGALAYYKLNPSLNAPPPGLQYSIDQLVQMGVYAPVTQQQLLTGYNVANQETLLASLRRRSVVADFEHHIFGDKLVVFGDLLYGFDRTESSVAGESLSPYISAPFTDPFIYGGSPPPPGAGAYVPYVPYLQPNSPLSPTWLFQPNAQGYNINLVNVNNQFSKLPAPVDRPVGVLPLRGRPEGRTEPQLLMGGRRRPQPLPPGAHEPGPDRHREPERRARRGHDQPVRLPAGLGDPAVQRHRDQDQQHGEHARVGRLPFPGHAV